MVYKIYWKWIGIHNFQYIIIIYIIIKKKKNLQIRSIYKGVPPMYNNTQSIWNKDKYDLFVKKFSLDYESYSLQSFTYIAIHFKL